MMKIFSRIMLLVSGTVFMVACAAPESGRSAVPLHVAFSSRWGDYTMIVADQAGFFEQYGVAVEPVYYDVAFESLVDLSAGNLDGGLMSLGDTINVLNHMSIKTVAVSDSGGSGTIVASREVQSIKDLKGKRVGVELGSSYELFVADMLESEGLTESDVTLINVRPEEMDAAVGFRVDAGYTWEPFAYRAISRGNHLLYDPEREAGLFPTVLTFKESTLESRPEDIRAFLNAWFAAVKFRQEHPNESRQLIASYFGLIAPDLSVDEQVQILDREQNLALFQKTSKTEDYTLFAAGEINAEFLMRIGVLTRLPNWDDLLDSSYLK